MLDSHGERQLRPNFEATVPEYLRKDASSHQRARLYGFMRCYDCPDEVPLEQADSVMCRKLHQTIQRLFTRGWTDYEILAECKRIYGNDILYKQYVPPPPMISYTMLGMMWFLYLLRVKLVRVRWERRIRYKSDPRGK